VEDGSVIEMHTVLKREIRIYKTIIFTYGSVWSLTLKEEHRLGVFEERLLRRIFEPKGDEVRRGWRSCITRSFVIFLFCK
jgi:hypothetical protein